MNNRPDPREGQPVHSSGRFAMDFRLGERKTKTVRAAATKQAAGLVIAAARAARPVTHGHRTPRRVAVFLTALRRTLQRVGRPVMAGFCGARQSFGGSRAGKMLYELGRGAWRRTRRFCLAVARSRAVRFVRGWPVVYKRIAAGALVIAVVAGGYTAVHNMQYHLSAGEAQLLSKPSVDTRLIKITKDGFSYNRTTEQQKDGFKAVLAAAQTDSTGKAPYEATLPKDAGRGITFGDSSSGLSFTMVPQFATAAGREQNGQVMYPEGMHSVHVYTFKRNGVKEDIVLDQAPGQNVYTKSWRLQLGDKLEARMLPGGGVGIYGPDQALSGNVTAGSSADQKLLDAARKNAKKDTLLFVLPAPYTTDASGAKQYEGIKFSLNKNMLTLTVNDMKHRTYPLAIDPSAVVTTTADFQQGTDDGMIDYSISDQISRGPISYGAPGSTTQQTSAFITARWAHSSIVYNGYLYIIGGWNGTTPYNDIQYCPINSDGSVGACTQQTNAFTTARYGQTSVVYNGYLYIIGGNGGGYQNDIQYCPINSNGSVGACTQQTNAFVTARYVHSSVVYNGYLYIIGGLAAANATGCNASGYCNDIQYCPLNANGSVGACTQQLNAFTTAREGQTSVVYNGYLYIIGGYSGANQNDIQYCPLNANGSVGACTQQTNAFVTARLAHASVVSSGYLYIFGGLAAANATGCNASGYCNDIQYCPLNANGSVGACTQQLNAFTTPRYNHSAVENNGYFYIIGGYSGANQNDIQYGLLGKYASTAASTQQSSAFTTARYGQGTTAYNGYLYISAGQSGSSTYQSDVQYCPLNTSGSVGACTQATNTYAAYYQSGYYYCPSGGTLNGTTCSYTATYVSGYYYCNGGDSLNGTTCTHTYYQNTQYTCPTSQPGYNAWVDYTSVNGNCYGFYYASGSPLSCPGGQFKYIAGGPQTTPSPGDFQCEKVQAPTVSYYCNSGDTGPSGGYCYHYYTANYTSPYYYCPNGGSLSGSTCTYNATYVSGYYYCNGGDTLSGTTCTSVNVLTAGRTGAGSVAYNGYLYIIGGYNGSYLNDIQRCTISASGAIATNSCTQQAAAFTTARAGMSAVVWGSYLYIIGGTNGTYQNDIQYCPLNANGSVGACTQQTNAFVTPRAYAAAAVNNGYLYITGGTNGTYQNDIQYCPLNANGSVGACTQQTNAFVTPRASHASAVSNGYLYITGGQAAANAAGCNSSGYCNDTQFCPLNSNGSVGTCTQQLSSFTTPRYGLGAVTANGFLYVVGGYSGSYLNDIQYMPIVGGTLYSPGTTTQQTNAFTTGRYGHSSVVYNGYLYIIGGNNNGTYYNDIQYCPLNTNGSVGACTQQAAAFTTPRYGHTSVAYNGYLYVIGGRAAASATGCDVNGYCNDIQYCPLNTNGSVGACTQQLAAFTGTRYYHTSVVNNGYLYIIGGSSSTGALNDILYCPINSNGSVGACTQKTGAFTSARYLHTSVVYNNYLYIIGGFDGTNYYNDIQYCLLNANGSVGTCTQQLNAFTAARYGQTSVVNNGYIYIVGGYNAGTYYNDIQYCPVNTNGSVGACTQETGSFTTGRYGHTSVVSNGFLYVVGGYNGTYQNDIQYIKITDRGFGAGGAATQQATAFTTARAAHTSVVYNGYLYIIGGYATANATGCNVNGYCNDIQYCPINSNGSVGACTQQLNAFTTPRYAHTSVVYNGYLYIIGGYATANATGCDANGYCKDIQYCPLNSNGSVGACTQQLNALVTPRYSHSSVVYNGYLYIIGGVAAGSTTGCDATGTCNDIQYCPINSNGSVGACTQQLNAFAINRQGHSSVVYNGYLYIIGGYGGSYLNDIQYCPLNSNGSVGACTQQTNAFATARNYYASVVYNGYLYIIGGWGGGTTYLNDIQYCPLNSNGSVGACTQQTNAFTTGRYRHTSVVYNGYLYIIGGTNGTYQNDIQRLPVGSPNQGANYEKIIDFGTVSGTATGFTVNGTAVCGLRVDIRTAGSNGIFGSTTTLYGVKTGTSYGIGQTNVRYVWFKVYMDDSSCGGTSSITDITINYTIVPDAPTLIAPASGATGVALSPAFQLRSRDGSGTDWARYKIQVCSDSLCSSVLRTVDQTSGQTGWTGQDSQSGTAYVTSSTLSSSTIANHTYQAPALAASTQYWWRAYAIDPGDSNTWSPASSIYSFTTNTAPAAPTPIAPVSGSTGTSVQPVFQLRTTDAESDYLRYKIQLCSDSACTGIIRTMDETSSQTGWSGQDQQGGTAYAGSATLSSSTIANHTYQLPALTPGTQYWWRAYAIDPGGSNTWSPSSAITSFTTPYPPGAPTLLTPITTGTSISPLFQLSTSDPENDYVRYKIQVCSDSLCSSVLRTVDQTSAQTGWFGQDAAGGTAYTTASAGLSQIGKYQWQPANLTPNTQYWWRAYAIDPGGSNTWSPASSIGTFTTANTEATIRGGSILRGGTIVR